MTRRYPSVVVALGAFVIAASAVGEWPVDETTALGVDLPLLAVLAGLVAAFLLVAGARWIDAIDPRAFAALVGVIAVGTFLVGGIGYAEVLFGEHADWLAEISALLAPVGTLLGAGIAIVGAIADVLDIEADVARRRTKATGFLAAVGISGLVSMIIWSQVLLLVLIVVTGRGPLFSEAVAISSLSLGLGMGTVAGAYLLMTNREWSFIDLKVPTLRDVGWIVVGTGGVFAALIVVGIVLQLLGVPSPEHGLIGEVTEQGDPTIFLYVLIPGTILIIGPGEELLFRNIIQKSLYEYFSKPAAVIVASLLFALAHIPAYWSGASTITALIVITVVSLVLGAVYVRTENVIVPAIIHGLFNAIQFGALYVEMTMGETAAVIPGLL